MWESNLVPEAIFYLLKGDSKAKVNLVPPRIYSQLPKPCRTSFQEAVASGTPSFYSDLGSGALSPKPKQDWAGDFGLPGISEFLKIRASRDPLFFFG